jgi:hypothetical protein
MSGFPRDLAVLEPWEVSLNGSRERRQKLPADALAPPPFLTNLHSFVRLAALVRGFAPWIPVTIYP